MERILSVQSARHNKMKFLTSGFSRKFGLRRIRRLCVRFGVYEGVGVRGADDPPAVARSVLFCRLEHFPSALNRRDSQPLSPRRIWGN